jgi:hypothetical protein
VHQLLHLAQQLPMFAQFLEQRVSPQQPIKATKEHLVTNSKL